MHRTTRRIAAAAIALLLIAGAGQAQSIDGQIDGLAAHAEDAANDAAANPQGAGANATSPAWQGREVNWTHEWTCDSVTAVEPGVAEELRDSGWCPARDTAAAGPEPGDAAKSEAERTVADAEELGEDAAASDAAAAADALVDEVVGDPGSTPGALQRFVERVREIVDDLVPDPVWLVELVADAVLDIVTEVLDGLGFGVSAAASFVGDGVMAAVDGIAHAATAATNAVSTGVSASGNAVADAVGHGVDAIADGLDAVKRSVGGLFTDDPTVRRDGRAGPIDVDAGTDAADGLLPKLELDL